MSSLLQSSVRNDLRQRAAALRPDTPAKWSKFDAPRVLAHAIQSLGMMTGDVHVAVARCPGSCAPPRSSTC